MATVEERIRSPVETETPTAYAGVRQTAYAGVSAPVAYAQVRPAYQAKTAYQAPFAYQAKTAAPVKPPERAYTKNRGPSPYALLQRTVRRLIVVIPKPRKPTGRWFFRYQDLWAAKPEDTGDEYDDQLEKGSEVDFDHADRTHRAYMLRCDEQPDEHPACIAEVLEGGMESVLEPDPEMQRTVGEVWDELLPEIMELRTKLAQDPLWMVDNMGGELTLMALNWASDLGNWVSMTGQQLRRIAAEQMETRRGFADALLDVAVFRYGYMIEEGQKLFKKISEQRTRSYFPYAPRQLLVFDRFNKESKVVDDGWTGLLGQYEVEWTEYFSNLGSCDPPKHGVVGWRVHHMKPVEECNGSAC